MRYSIILFALLIAGCGQKGALYVPNEKSGDPVTAIIIPAPVANTDINKTAE
jgi:predicted small lipoprotein YifL